MDNGAFVEIEFVGKVKDTGEIFDLTDENLAKEKKIYSPYNKYGPTTIILGNKQILPAVEAAVKGMSAGEKKTVVVEPKNGFGERDPKLFRIIPLSSFTKENRYPSVGEFIMFGNIRGRVVSISSGRVNVDFNHPLSGKVLEYDLKLDRIVEKTEEKISSIVSYYLNLAPKSVIVDSQAGAAKIELALPEKQDLPEGIKQRVSDEIKKHVSGIKEVGFSKDSNVSKASEAEISAAKNAEI